MQLLSTTFYLHFCLCSRKPKIPKVYNKPVSACCNCHLYTAFPRILSSEHIKQNKQTCSEISAQSLSENQCSLTNSKLNILTVHHKVTVWPKTVFSKAQNHLKSLVLLCCIYHEYVRGIYKTKDHGKTSIQKQRSESFLNGN